MMLSILFYAVLGGLLVAGGLGEYVFLVVFVGYTLFALGLIVYLLVEREMKFPSGVFAYVLFLLFQGASFFWTVEKAETFKQLVFYLSGGLVWLLAYNLAEKLEGKLGNLVLGLGGVMAILYGWARVTGIEKVRAWSLYLYNNRYLNNNHIGDLWVLVVLVVGIWWLNRKKWWQLVLMIVGMGLVIVSQSRAALVALLAGGWYIKEVKEVKVNEWVRRGLLLLMLGGFLVVGMTKRTLTSRQYFVQALAGLWHYPLGVGLGNFSEISGDKAMHLWGLSDYATVVFNLPLEVMVGLGWLGLVFVWWMGKRAWEVGKVKIKKGLMARVIFVALGVNFMLSASYFQSSMFWLWMISLGVSQRIKR